MTQRKTGGVLLVLAFRIFMRKSFALTPLYEYQAASYSQTNAVAVSWASTIYNCLAIIKILYVGGAPAVTRRKTTTGITM
ncbi:MAG: hypothetical protein KUG81_07820 [Gammaproteobacteria bacterium]|nr:hypothetical protein [Gammaproteobacteria bacterium]